MSKKETDTKCVDYVEVEVNPHLQLETEVNFMLNEVIGGTMSIIEMLGLEGKREETVKRSIKKIVRDAQNNFQQWRWGALSQEAKEFILNFEKDMPIGLENDDGTIDLLRNVKRDS